MLKCYCMRVVLAISAMVLCACAPSPRVAITEGETISYELIVAKELDILDLASEAIRACFPDAVVSSLPGKEKGFTFSTEHFPERFNKFLITKAYGATSDGNDIVGYRYFIYADGQLLSPESSDVQPLIGEFKRRLADKGITLIWVQSIKSR